MNVSLVRKGLALLVAGWLASSPGAARSNPVADMLRNSDPALLTGERKGFEEQLRAKPADLTLWLAYADYSYRYDQPTETLALLDRALQRIPGAVELWRLQAEVYLQDAASGPGWVRRPGVSRGRSPQSKLSEEEFRAQSFAGALAALDRLLVLQPGNREAAERRVDALAGLSRWAEAEATLVELIRAKPDPVLLAQRARAALQQERTADALALLEAALVTYPRSPHLHYVRSLALKASGDIAGQAAAEEQADFYGRLMPDTQLDYTPELAASYARLFGHKEGTGGMFAADRLNDQIDAEIEVLRKRGDDSARELLAGLAWTHYAHGTQEDRAFATLAEYHDEPRLQRIYAQAQSTCTLGGCLRQMVKLRAPGTYEKLCEQLPRDGGLFGMETVWLLGELNDPRAVQPLITYSRDKEAASFDEALVVLGRFDSPATRKHLDYWMKDDEARPFAAAALYRITRDERLLKPVRKSLKKDRLYDASLLVGALEDIETPAARKIVTQYEQWQKESEAERARQRAKDAAELEKRKKEKNGKELAR